MGESAELGRAMLLVSGSNDPVSCDVLEWEDATASLSLPDEGSGGIAQGTHVAVVRSKNGAVQPHSGVIDGVAGGAITVRFTPAPSPNSLKDEGLSDCQLPAMIRSKDAYGNFGSWKTAVILKHGPDRLLLQVMDDHSIPDRAELLFNPIGAEGSGGSGRMYADDGSVISALDMRSRRIRVRATTVHVLASEQPGTLQLVMDVSRALYRAA
ncbi:MAG TPA: hypothetical protein VNI20_03210 [Fimbriimonadaceae bacterium]|nr:hypothetical protein [Fimbriimonadaceae bacterium]